MAYLAPLIRLDTEVCHLCICISLLLLLLLLLLLFFFFFEKHLNVWHRPASGSRVQYALFSRPNFAVKCVTLVDPCTVYGTYKSFFQQFFHYLKSHLSSIQSMNRSTNLLMKIMGLMEKIIPGFSFWTQILFSDIVWEKFERFAVGFSHRHKRGKKIENGVKSPFV